MDKDLSGRIAVALEQSVQGNHGAFAEIVRGHQGMVFSIAYHFLRDAASAEDLAQEVFLDLYQCLDRIDSPEHLIHWLRRVTVHRCIDQNRRQKTELGLDEVPEPCTDIAVTDLLLNERLLRTVACLPEQQRIMVILRYQEDLGPDEISRLLDMPVNTVKSTLQRALAELRKRLARNLGDVRYAIF